MNSITIRKKLESDIIILGRRAKSLLGKKVEIVITEMTTPPLKKKQWKHIGAVSLAGKADNINIRDFAYDN